MLKVISRFICFLPLFLYVNVAYCNDDKYFNEAWGFSITKPSNWHFLSSSVIEEHRENIQFNDESVMQKLKNKARLPIVTIVKYQDPMNRQTVTPTVQVVVSAVDESETLQKIIYSAAAAIEQSAESFNIVNVNSDLSISGLPAASAEFEVTVLNSDKESFKLVSKLNLVRRGKLVFGIGTSGPPSGPDKSDDAFDEIVKSIILQK